MGGVRFGSERRDLAVELTGGRMRRRIVIVSDKMQRGYRYYYLRRPAAISTRNSGPI